MKIKVFFLTVLFLAFSLTFYADERPVIFSDGLSPNSYVWQIEEFAKWLIRSRDLIVRPSACRDFCFVINNITFYGSLENNEINFILKGHLTTEFEALVPLFGQPQRVFLQNVTINNTPAIIGFDNKDFYYCRTSDRDFTIRGQLSFFNETSFTVVGPVNTLINEVSDARIAQGNNLSGLKNRLIHFESTKIEPIVVDRPEIQPLFQINRAIRISNDITFEYFVHIRSASEISNYIIPMDNSETVLQVTGTRDYKIEDGRIIINSPQKTLNIRITGTLKNLRNLSMDERSNYEWWLIESDPQHKVNVTTQGKQIDSSESPMPRVMSLSRLYFLSKGNTISIEYQKLQSLEALAVLIHSHTRRIIWTKDGDIIARDSFVYENSGVDYLIFDTLAKPIYLEVNQTAQRLFSFEGIPDTAVMLPLLKGRHSAVLQSLGWKRISPFFGHFPVPAPEHSLTISKASLEFGIPKNIIPLYFSEGDGFINPFSSFDIFIFIVLLLLCIIIHKKNSLRLFSIISFTGLYAVFGGFFIIVIILAFLAKLLFYLKNRYSKNTFILIIGASFLLLILIFIYSLVLPVFFSKATTAYTDASHYAMESQVAPPPPSRARSMAESERVGQVHVEYDAIRREERVLSESSIIEGAIPVELPMPGFSRLLRAEKELITRERPMKAKLYYTTDNVLVLLYIIWFISLLIMILHYYPHIKPVLTMLKPKETN